MLNHVAGDAVVAGFEPAVAAKQALARLGRPPAIVLVFTAQRGTGVGACEQVVPLAGGAPVVAVECGGVLATGGEREAEGVTVYALGSDEMDVALHVLPSDPAAARAEIVTAVKDTVLVCALLTPPLYGPEIVAAMGDGEKSEMPVVVGGGAQRVFVASGGKAPTAADGVLVAIRSRTLRAAGVSSPAARLLTPWRTLTEVQGQFLLAVDGTPMSEWLASTPSPSTQGSPMFVAVRSADTDAALLLRSVAGIDPKRGGVAVNEPIENGTQIALAVWDGAAARTDLAQRVATLARETAGGVPVAGFMMTCVGRGLDLFGTKDVDVEAVRSRFPSMPFAGMFSQFELARFEGAPRIHIYTASIAVLYRPS